MLAIESVILITLSLIYRFYHQMTFSFTMTELTSLAEEMI